MNNPTHQRHDLPKVLYVDDQVGNLTVFRASLRRFADIRTARSGAEALEILEQECFPIIISDQRMDGMSGSELLAEVRRRHPDTVRMLLTAHTDFNAVVEAVNEGRITRFVGKPWKREEMRAILSDAHELYWSAHEKQALRDESEALAPFAMLGRRTADGAGAFGAKVRRGRAADPRAPGHDCVESEPQGRFRCGTQAARHGGEARGRSVCVGRGGPRHRLLRTPPRVSNSAWECHWFGEAST